MPEIALSRDVESLPVLFISFCAPQKYRIFYLLDFWTLPNWLSSLNKSISRSTIKIHFGNWVLLLLLCHGRKGKITGCKKPWIGHTVYPYWDLWQVAYTALRSLRSIHFQWLWPCAQYRTLEYPFWVSVRKETIKYPFPSSCQ